MNKNWRKVGVLILCLCFIVGHYLLFDDDRYIVNNIRKIDRADSVTIISDETMQTYPFNEPINELVSYGGEVIEVDNIAEKLYSPYSNTLTKLNITIIYKEGKSTLATADVFASNEHPEEYFLYMNHVYWCTGATIRALREFIA